MDEMTWVEILLYLKGLNDRDRATYDAMRIQTANIIGGMGAKMENGGRVEPSDIYQFPDEVKRQMIKTAKNAVADKERLVNFLKQCNAENRAARQHATE